MTRPAQKERIDMMKQHDLEERIKTEVQREVDEAVGKACKEIEAAMHRLWYCTNDTPYNAGIDSLEWGQRRMLVAALVDRILHQTQKERRGFPAHLWNVRREKKVESIMRTMNDLQKLLMTDGNYTPIEQPAGPDDKAPEVGEIAI